MKKEIINFINRSETLKVLTGEQKQMLKKELEELLTNCGRVVKSKQYGVELESGEELTIIETSETLIVADNFRQTLEEYDLIYSNIKVDDIINEISKLTLYDYLDKLSGSYDWSSELKQIKDTYIEDITIGNGEEAVKQEVEQMEHDYETMPEEEFCVTWGIYKIEDIYVKP